LSTGSVTKKIFFELDTAVDVTMLPSHVFPDLLLNKCKSNIFSAKKHERLKIKGTPELLIKYKNSEITEKVFVSDDVSVALLSRKACIDFNLVKRVYMMNQEIDWRKEFPSLFSGLGNIKGDYTIELKENARPYAIASPKAVPLPLRKKVEEALQDMVKRRVIEPVDHATDWCAVHPWSLSAKKTEESEFVLIYHD